MAYSVDYASFIALIDDDARSADLLSRTLRDQSAPNIQHYGGADAALARLTGMIAVPPAHRPAMVIVDLKAHSGANLEFLGMVAPIAAQLRTSFVVLTAQPDQQSRHALQDQGAAAVFIRHADRDAYRRVAADLVEFWALTQRLVAVGM